jgi:hypothetical protein
MRFGAETISSLTASWITEPAPIGTDTEEPTGTTTEAWKYTMMKNLSEAWKKVTMKNLSTNGSACEGSLQTDKEFAAENPDTEYAAPPIVPHQVIHGPYATAAQITIPDNTSRKKQRKKATGMSGDFSPTMPARMKSIEQSITKVPLSDNQPDRPTRRTSDKKAASHSPTKPTRRETQRPDKKAAPDRSTDHSPVAPKQTEHDDVPGLIDLEELLL